MKLTVNKEENNKFQNHKKFLKFQNTKKNKKNKRTYHPIEYPLSPEETF